MDLFRQIDSYCERTDFSFWSEPVNAITNAAFIIAALIMWRRSAGVPLARVLCVVLAAIGVGSFLFHTTATIWGSIADTFPILLFVLIYIYAANRHYWGMRPVWAGVAVLGFFPFAAAVGPLMARVPVIGVSAPYWPVALMILGYGVALRSRLPQVARGLLIGGGILCLSLLMRSIDMPVCHDLPLGTHFMWHVLNGIMLGWMIEVLQRHQRA